MDNSFNEVINIDSIISVGRYPILNNQEVLTSYSLASDLDLVLFNSSGIFEIFSVNPRYPESALNPIGNTRKVLSSGVFTPRNEVNGKLIIADIKIAKSLFAISDKAFSEILIKSEEPKSSVAFLRENLSNYRVRTHKELNESLYKIMNSEKLIVSLIMLLIVFVSTFNVIASTVMLIVEKESDVKTMKAIGMSKKKIKSIFFKHNLLLNSIGGIIGIAFSTILIYAQLKLSFFKIPGLDVAYPVSLDFANIIFVLITIIITGLCSAYFSSLVVKKLN